jgi:hypothetical protein
MRRQLIKLLVLFLLNVSVEGQVQHAPTLAQCRADEHLWTVELTEYYRAETDTLTNGTINHSSLAGISFKELNERAVEMGSCIAVDPANTERYSNVGMGLTAITGDRFGHFLLRHNLMNQFLDEDAAGKR